ncbi:MAG: hypothetical protein ACRD6W_02910, partial [Nitrososphaerales archaeon]
MWVETTNGFSEPVRAHGGCLLDQYPRRCSGESYRWPKRAGRRLGRCVLDEDGREREQFIRLL